MLDPVQSVDDVSGVSVDQHHHDRRWFILGILALAQLMVVLDATVVNIALPTAQHALGFSNSDRQWIVTAYALAFGGLLLFGGRLSDLIGRKRALIIGMAGFAVASAIGGASTSFAMLAISRAIQGSFAALLAPAALAMLTTTFVDADERRKAFGVYGAVAGAGGGIGLLLGGVLTEYVSWRWCLYINVPIAIFAVVATMILMRQTERPHGVTIDVQGTLAVTTGLVAIVYGLANVATSSWSNGWTIGPLVVGVALLVVFVLIERRVAHPLLPMRVVLDRNRGGSFIAFALAGAGMLGVFLFLTYYFEKTLAYSPVKTGIAFLPMIASVMVSANLATVVLTRRLGTRTVLSSGMALAAIGMALFTRIGVTSSYGSIILPALIVAGVGIGFIFAPGMAAATSGISGSDAGVASAMINVNQQVGGSIGIAFLNTIAVSAASAFVVGKAPSAELETMAAVHSYIVTFWWSAGIFAVGAIISVFLLTKLEEPPPVIDVAS
jgi:EmrB/QacA subfamily drug resistance transporter